MQEISYDADALADIWNVTSHYRILPGSIPFHNDATFRQDIFPSALIYAVIAASRTTGTADAPERESPTTLRQRLLEGR